jgi:RNase P/RNase MRP subunit p29
MVAGWMLVSLLLLLAYTMKERYSKMSFNVRAAKEARLAKNGATFDFDVDGDVFKIPTELPVDKLEALATQDGNLRDLFAVLLGTEARDKLFSHELSGQDCRAIMDEYAKATGASLPEGSDSSSS